MSHKKFSSAQRAPSRAGPGDKSKDAPTAEVEIPVGGDTSEKTLKVTTESSREDTDRQAIERGDDGMIVHQGATSSAHNRGDLNAITER